MAATAEPSFVHALQQEFCWLPVVLFVGYLYIKRVVAPVCRIACATVEKSAAHGDFVLGVDATRKGVLAAQLLRWWWLCGAYSTNVFLHARTALSTLVADHIEMYSLMLKSFLQGMGRHDLGAKGLHICDGRLWNSRLLRNITRLPGSTQISFPDRSLPDASYVITDGPVLGRHL